MHPQPPWKVTPLRRRKSGAQETFAGAGSVRQSHVSEANVLATVPRFRFSEEEHAQGAPHEHTLRDTCAAFRTHGCLVLENTYSPPLIESLRETFFERYAHFIDGEQDPQHSLIIGHKRVQLTVEVKKPFNNPLLYANPLAFPILAELLGPTAIMGVFGAVMSLPGSEPQHVHRDHPALFEDDDINRLAPPFAVTMAIPLVALTEETGTTRMWVGSHVLTDAQARDVPYDDPKAAVGACMLFDLRLRHGGLANQSRVARPMLYNNYCRPWFIDSRNYTVQKALVMEEDEFNRMHRANRRLFVRAETPDGRRLTFADPYKNLQPT